MWIVEWSCLSEYEFSITGWASEDDALKQACKDLVNHIDSLDMMDDDDLFMAAEAVNEFVTDKKYREAIQYWNDCTFNNDCSDSVCWTVRQLTPQRFQGSTVPNLNHLFEGDEDVPSITAVTVVNDHTCVTCGNDKCSKRETSCWKCGNPIS